MKKCGFLIVLFLIMFLPVQAIAVELPTNSQYTIEVTLSGGSGRAKVESPTEITITDGAAKATVIWSSPYYEYMLVDGTYFYPINTRGNSTFEIPIVLNENMAVSAQTIAMSEPHEIDYTLYFDSTTLKPLADNGSSLIPLGAGAAAILIIILAGVFLLKKLQKENRI